MEGKVYFLGGLVSRGMFVVELMLWMFLGSMEREIEGEWVKGKGRRLGGEKGMGVGRDGCDGYGGKGEYIGVGGEWGGKGEGEGEMWIGGEKGGKG